MHNNEVRKSAVRKILETLGRLQLKVCLYSSKLAFISLIKVRYVFFRYNKFVLKKFRHLVMISVESTGKSSNSFVKLAKTDYTNISKPQLFKRLDSNNETFLKV